jgi:hypothetical protein
VHPVRRELVSLKDALHRAAEACLARQNHSGDRRRLWHD